MPSRIQRSRAKGWRLPPGAIIVDRSTKWGNPYRVGQRNPFGTITQDNRHAVSLYVGFAPQNEKPIAAARAELRGHDLACWCRLCDLHREHGKPFGVDCPYCEPCHADPLGALANAAEPAP